MAAWLAERHLFDEDDVEVVFVGRKRPVRAAVAVDCAVDVWNVYDPECLVFDHKPPAFADRNQTCATRLVWEYLVSQGRSVQHLAALVQAVHEGDRNPPGRGGAALEQSKRDGLHAHFAQIRPLCRNDDQRYQVIRSWLDAYDVAHKANRDK